jgi:hypothetical protein
MFQLPLWIAAQDAQLLVMPAEESAERTALYPRKW